jgi:hypothetical protein
MHSKELRGLNNCCCKLQHTKVAGRWSKWTRVGLVVILQDGVLNVKNVCMKEEKNNKEPRLVFFYDVCI